MAERVRRLIASLMREGGSSREVTRAGGMRFRVVCRLCGQPTLLALRVYVEAEVVSLECGGCTRELVAVIRLPRQAMGEPSWYRHLDRDDLPSDGNHRGESTV